MHPLLHLLPAVLCAAGAVFMALSLRIDLGQGTLHWRDAEAAAGGAIVLACILGATVSLMAAAGVLAR